jgi:hypothetical protein
MAGGRRACGGRPAAAGAAERIPACDMPHMGPEPRAAAASAVSRLGQAGAAVGAIGRERRAAPDGYLARRKPMRSRTVAMVAPATSRARAAPCASNRSSCSSSASIFSVRSLIGANALTTTSARSFLNVP